MTPKSGAVLALLLAASYAQNAHAIRNELDPPDPAARPAKHLVTYPATGKMRVSYKNGTILVDDAANTITVTTGSYGTFTVNIDSAALSEAGGDVNRAATIRQEFHQALNPADGVTGFVSDANGNHLLDEAIPATPDCSNADIACTGYIRTTPAGGGKDEFKRMFANTRMGNGSVRPSPEMCVLMCDKAESMMEDYLLDSAEVVLACGLAETPPTAALCGLVVLRWRQHLQENAHADYVCHVECMVP